MILGLRIRLRRNFVLVAAGSFFLSLGALFPFPALAQNLQTAPAKQGAGAAAKTSDPFREVRDLIRQGLLEMAKSKVQTILDSDPNNAEAYNFLGTILARQKDFPGADAAYHKALKLSPNSVHVHNNLGSLYIADRKNDLAEKEFRAAVRLDPANADANYNLSLLLLAANHPAEAIPLLLHIRAANLETRFQLVRAYLEAHRTAEGLKVANELSQQRPDDVQLHFTLGLLLASAKEYHPAELELEKANALKPETFEILFNLGQAYLRSKDYSKSEQALNRALTLKSDSSDTLYLLAQVCVEQNRSVDALDLLARARKLAPENPDIIFLLARVSMTQNYFEDAIPLLESGLKIAPRRPDLHAALGESLFMSGKTDKAVEEFQKLVQLDPSPRSYTFLGLSYRHLGRFDEARKYFQEGLKLSPRDSSCLFNLGFIEENQGNHARAEELFQQALRSNPDYAEALLELANLRTSAKRFEDAAVLLRRYVKIARDPASGYYKLAMVERSLHQLDAAQRDLSVFQTLSKNTSVGPYPYQHLFDYLDNRSTLSSEARTLLDITELNEQIKKHPDQPQDIYLLAEAYLKLGKFDDARAAVSQLDQLSSSDYRTQAGVGVLLARFRLYDDAVHHFQNALAANPDSDEVKYDLADAYFRKGQYSQALETAQQVSSAGQQDDTLLSLLGDIHAHLGDAIRAQAIFRDAIRRNPDNDQNYLSLSLVQLRQNDVASAEQTLRSGLARIPSSGKLLWGLGIVAALEGKTPDAAKNFERAVDLLPEWPGSYSTLGIFYYQNGEIAKAREVLNRFKGSNAAGGFDINRIEQALANAPATPSTMDQPMPAAARQQLLQMALSIADRTL